MPSDSSLNRIDSSASANSAAPISWAKIADPNQSIRITDSIKPLKDDEFNDDEILFGSTKAAGMMHFKMRADAAILQKLEDKKIQSDRLRTKGRFQVQVATSAEQWVTDRDWKMKANPIAAEA